MGCCAGPAIGIWLVIIGLVLCFTGIGAILGIPLMIAGILVAIVAPFMGAAGIKGMCPHCGHLSVHASVSDIGQGGVTCTACRQRIVIRGKRYYKTGE